MSTVTKFIEGFIVDKLKGYLNERTHKKQFGSKQGVCIDELKMKVINRLTELRDKYKGKRQPSHKKLPRIMFIDYKNAFDSVPWQPLFDLLDSKKILNPLELQLLKFVYGNIRISNGKGKMVSISKGTPQGMSTSPLLFEIYIDSILSKLEESTVESYLFADDLALIAEN